MQKQSNDYAGDAFPGSEPELLENRGLADHTVNPEQEPGQEEYNFFYGNGQLHVSDAHDHSELASHAQVGEDHTGPMAVGHINVIYGKATFDVNSNIHAQGLARVLKDYCKDAGWRWGGLTSSGEPIGTGSEFAPTSTYHYIIKENGLANEVQISKRTLKTNKVAIKAISGVIHVDGKYADVQPLPAEHFEAFKEFADDQGLLLVSRNDNVLKTIEDLELNNNYTPEWNTDDHMLQDPPDQRAPGGVYKCPECSQIFPNWGVYIKHRKTEEPQGENLEDGKFPELDMDATMPAHFHEQPKFTEAKVAVSKTPHYNDWGQPCRCGFYREWDTHHTANKLHDHLMNPKQRADLQTPEAQELLHTLERRYHNDKTDALMPWLVREWKKGRIDHNGDLGTLTFLEPDGVHRRAIMPETLEHWADFIRSSHPLKREMGDIMQQDVHSFSSRTADWTKDMADRAQQKALEGGEVIHTTPDGWTIRNLTKPEELKAEGDGMGHCVGSYDGDVASGRSIIHSLRDPKGVPHATVEISPNRFTEDEPFDVDGAMANHTVFRNPEIEDSVRRPLRDYHHWKAQGGDGPMPESVANFGSPENGLSDLHDLHVGLKNSWVNYNRHNRKALPHGGEVVQIQGKHNEAPKPEYQERLKHYFQNYYNDEDRPTQQDAGFYDPRGYWVDELREPDHIESAMGTEGDAYGLGARPLPADYDELMKNIGTDAHGYYDTHNGDHVQSIYDLAKRRNEIPQLVRATQGYGEKQDENFQDWIDMNWEQAPRHPYEDEPHGEDEKGPFWTPEGEQGERYHNHGEAEQAYDGAMSSWQEQHPGTQAANHMYSLLRPHFDTTTGLHSNEITQQDPTRVAADQPKDMIQGPVPFIYDVQEDTVTVGHPGTRTSDIPGKFTPGGIVEGTYEPGGKIAIRSLTNMPYTVRHMLELWYYQHPHMEITGVHLEDDEGKRTTLAANEDKDIGGYLTSVLAADPTAWKADHALRGAGGQVFIVGGAVRDALLGKPPKDIDLMVTGVPADEVDAILRKLPGRVDLTGKDFGVFRYKDGHGEVEIALPRRERSTGESHKDFDVQADHTMKPEEDLYRRDFTINAMAVNTATGQLLDPHNGVRDIQSGKLRTLNDKSLADDPLRTVRALVASSKHGVEPDEETKQQMEDNAAGLQHLPRERIQAELDKLFASKDPAKAIELARDTGLLPYLFPHVDRAMGYSQNNPHHELLLGDHLVNVLKRTAEKSDDPDLRLAGLLHDIGKPDSHWTECKDCGHYGHGHFKPCNECGSFNTSGHFYQKEPGIGGEHEDIGADQAGEWMRDMKYPADRIKRVQALVQHHMFPAFASPKGARKFLNKVGDHADDLLKLRWADQGGKSEYPTDPSLSVDEHQRLIDEARQEQAPTQRSQLAINGSDLLALGIPAGPQVGMILNKLMDAVVDNPDLNNKQSLLALAEQEPRTATTHTSYKLDDDDDDSAIWSHVANILDPIHEGLSPYVWNKPDDPEPKLRPEHRSWIVDEVHKLAEKFHPHPDAWLSLVLTGSLTTYQYSEASDVDISLFVDHNVLPEWDRAKLIGLMVSEMDGKKLPGTPFPMQCFVVPPEIHRDDLYQHGLRSGYDIDANTWIIPPDPARTHDVEREYNAYYIYALESADKMERLLKYEPDKAVQFWHQIHKRRQRDQRVGKGDFSESNIVYKFLANRNLFPAISEVSGEYIAAAQQPRPKIRGIFQDFKVNNTHPGPSDHPYIYSPEHGMAFVGPAGSFHWDLLRKTPELKDSYDLDGYMKAAPFLQRPDHVHGRLDMATKAITAYGDPHPLHIQNLKRDLGWEKPHNWDEDYVGSDIDNYIWNDIDK